MSQITIVDNVLDFTEFNGSASAAFGNARHAELPGTNSEPSRFEGKSLNEEEQRVAHELTSILISGRLPS